MALVDLLNASSQPKSPEPCSLGCSLCEGRGVYLASAHSRRWVEGELCSCVKNCKNCKGEAQFFKKGAWVSCSNPSPQFLAALIHQAEIPIRYGEARLERFKNFSGNLGIIHQSLQKWVHEFSLSQSKGLILSGPVGVGKTYLLCALALKLVLQGVRVKFVDFFNLLSVIRNGYSSKKSEKEILDPLLKVDVLIVDELGKGRNNDFEMAIIDQLVMGRYNEKKLFLASTNFSLGSPKKEITELDRIPSLSGSNVGAVQGILESRVGSRIYSRLMESCYFLSLEGQDFRRKNL